MRKTRKKVVKKFSRNISKTRSFLRKKFVYPKFIRDIKNVQNDEKSMWDKKVTWSKQIFPPKIQVQTPYKGEKIFCPKIIRDV